MGDRANINSAFGGRQSHADGEAIMSAMGGDITRLGALTRSGTLTNGVAASGVMLVGCTNGSTVAFNIAGISVTTVGSARTVTGTPAASGALTATETLVGMPGSPRVTPIGNVG